MNAVIPAHIADLDAFSRPDETFGFSVRHLHILALAVARRQVTAQEIGTELALSHWTVSRLAGDLIRGGQLARTQGDDDRRYSVFAPTPAGRALDAAVRRRLGHSRGGRARVG